MPRVIYVLLILLTSVQTAFAAQGTPPDSIRVVTWNLEWWADGSTHDATTQVAKTKTLLAAIDADFYGFQEVVNADSFYNMAAVLPGGPWQALVSPYGSFAPNPGSSEYASAQKLGFLYRPSQFRNVTSRAFLDGHPYAYGDFASGRYPFLVQGELRCADGSWKPVSFIILHAKAMSDARSCNRREEGAYILKDTLDRKFSGKDFLLLGDFNDDLDTSICVDRLQSSYSNFVNDSVGVNAYDCLTLPISRTGERSLDNYSSLLDHFISSSTLATYNKPNSTHSLRAFVNATVSDYTSDVSDHYPVITTFYQPASALAVAALQQTLPLGAFPNPAHNVLHLSGLKENVVYQLMDLSGRMLQEGRLSVGNPTVRIEALPQGSYLLQVKEKNAAHWLRFVKE